MPSSRFLPGFCFLPPLGGKVWGHSGGGRRVGGSRRWRPPSRRPHRLEPTVRSVRATARGPPPPAPGKPPEAKLLCPRAEPGPEPPSRGRQGMSEESERKRRLGGEAGQAASSRVGRPRDASPARPGQSAGLGRAGGEEASSRRTLSLPQQGCGRRGIQSHGGVMPAGRSAHAPGVQSVVTGERAVASGGPDVTTSSRPRVFTFEN